MKSIEILFAGIIHTYSECRSPTERLYKGSMESTEINERICSEIKVGNQWSDEIKLSNEKENGRYEKDKDITSIGLSILSIGFREENDSRVDAINAKSLNETWN